MAWIRVGNDIEPDGQPFEDPRDSFERTFNAVLARGGVPDVEELPLSTRIMERDPESPEAARNLLDWFFDPFTQDKALDAGSPHEELDHLAREAFRWAIKYGVPITDPERIVAKRLGVAAEHLGRKALTRSTYHRLGC
ncbi:hypothetical protein D3C86_1262290 [compost metagenome]